jgi:hypothetical protein
MAQNQDRRFDPQLGIELFRYDYRGLSPTEIHYQVDSLSASQIYKRAQFALEFGSDILVDVENRILKKIENKSFILKGLRYDVFCGEGLFGNLCMDAKYEIYFEFYDGGYLVKPIKIKRGANFNNTVWQNIPFKGPANFYRKDGTLKKQCVNCPLAIENILQRVVTWTYRTVTRVELIDSNPKF